MAIDHLGPAHPCLGCQHRSNTRVVNERKNLPGSLCLHLKAPKQARTPICWGDPLPEWCPEPKGRNRE